MGTQTALPQQPATFTPTPQHNLPGETQAGISLPTQPDIATDLPEGTTRDAFTQTTNPTVMTPLISTDTPAILVPLFNPMPLVRETTPHHGPQATTIQPISSLVPVSPASVRNRPSALFTGALALAAATSLPGCDTNTIIYTGLAGGMLLGLALGAAAIILGNKEDTKKVDAAPPPKETAEKTYEQLYPPIGSGTTKEGGLAKTIQGGPSGAPGARRTDFREPTELIFTVGGGTHTSQPPPSTGGLDEMDDPGTGTGTGGVGGPDPAAQKIPGGNGPVHDDTVVEELSGLMALRDLDATVDGSGTAQAPETRDATVVDQLPGFLPPIPTTRNAPTLGGAPAANRPPVLPSVPATTARPAEQRTLAPQTQGMQLGGDIPQPPQAPSVRSTPPHGTAAVAPAAKPTAPAVAPAGSANGSDSGHQLPQEASPSGAGTARGSYTGQQGQGGGQPQAPQETMTEEKLLRLFEGTYYQHTNVLAVYESSGCEHLVKAALGKNTKSQTLAELVLKLNEYLIKQYLQTFQGVSASTGPISYKNLLTAYNGISTRALNAVVAEPIKPNLLLVIAGGIAQAVSEVNAISRPNIDIRKVIANLEKSDRLPTIAVLRDSPFDSPAPVERPSVPNPAGTIAGLGPASVPPVAPEPALQKPKAMIQPPPLTPARPAAPRPAPAATRAEIPPPLPSSKGPAKAPPPVFQPLAPGAPRPPTRKPK